MSFLKKLGLPFLFYSPHFSKWPCILHFFESSSPYEWLLKRKFFHLYIWKFCLFANPWQFTIKNIWINIHNFNIIFFKLILWQHTISKINYLAIDISKEAPYFSKWSSSSDAKMYLIGNAWILFEIFGVTIFTWSKMDLIISIEKNQS